MSTRNVVEVFTNKSKDFMLEYGGSASWVISTSSGAALDYCVCCRNDERPREDDRGTRPERRNEAFFVGKVSGIEFVERSNNRDRYLIRFSEYTEVSVPGFRPASMRNPVLYSDVEDCRLRGVNIEALEFKPMPDPAKHYERQSTEHPEKTEISKGLTIAEAKRGLSVGLGIDETQIEILIKA